MVWDSLSVVYHPVSPFTICVTIISEPIKRISSNFSCRLPWIWPRVEIDIFEKKTTHFLTFSDFLNFWLTLDPMRAKISKHCSSLRSLLNFFKLLLIFFLKSPHKSTFLDFWNFDNLNFNRIFQLWNLNTGPYGSENFKTLLLFKSLLNYSKLLLNFLLSGPHKRTILDFWNLEFPIFNEFFKFTIVPYLETKNLNYLENERP